jgi:hypothetical protein
MIGKLNFENDSMLTGSSRISKELVNEIVSGSKGIRGRAIAEAGFLPR